MRRANLWAAGLLVALGLPAAAAAEDVDSPYYQRWSGWREGATATSKTESVTEGIKGTITATATLKRLAADKVVLEVSTVSEFGGQKITTPPVPTDLLARLPKAVIEPKGKVTTGRETLTVNGKQLACEWTQVEDEAGEVTKTWTCKDVPGGVVKATTRSANSSSTSQLIEWKGDKK